MNHRSLYGRFRAPLSIMATTTVAAALLAASIGPASAGKSSAPPRRKPTLVLVHGAFADSTSWHGVVRKLQREGYPVVAAANPLRGLGSDAAYLKHLLASIDGPVVLAGHSYGGSVITDAAHGVGNVKALVYVAAFIPDQGESALSLSERFPGSTLGSALRPVPIPLPDGSEESDYYIGQTRFHHQFAADVPKNTADLMAVTQRPVTASALGEGASARLEDHPVLGVGGHRGSQHSRADADLHGRTGQVAHHGSTGLPRRERLPPRRRRRHHQEGGAHDRLTGGCDTTGRPGAAPPDRDRRRPCTGPGGYALAARQVEGMLPGSRPGRRHGRGQGAAADRITHDPLDLDAVGRGLDPTTSRPSGIAVGPPGGRPHRLMRVDGPVDDVVEPQGPAVGVEPQSHQPRFVIRETGATKCTRTVRGITPGAEGRAGLRYRPGVDGDRGCALHEVPVCLEQHGASSPFRLGPSRR